MNFTYVMPSFPANARYKIGVTLQLLKAFALINPDTPRTHPRPCDVQTPAHPHPRHTQLAGAFSLRIPKISSLWNLDKREAETSSAAAAECLPGGDVTPLGGGRERPCEAPATW